MGSNAKSPLAACLAGFWYSVRFSLGATLPTSISDSITSLGGLQVPWPQVSGVAIPWLPDSHPPAYLDFYC